MVFTEIMYDTRRCGHVSTDFFSNGIALVFILENAEYHAFDSSSLTNEKDHHYFLNSADVCW